jgi:hypothetical protein
MADNAWFALVEENSPVGGVGLRDTYAWRLMEIIPVPAGVEIEELVHDVALKFSPVRPAFPTRRSVFRVNAETYVVRVEGATSAHHFRVTAAEHIADLNGQEAQSGPSST